jgi:hypothetical protein
VFDNGSHDGTWDIVQGLARQLPAVIPFKTELKPFTDSLRGEILRHYRARARRGDWWAIIDADEFYIDDPRAFLARVPHRYRAVWPQLYAFLFTDIDAQAYDQDPRGYASEIPVTERLRHYVLGQYSEVRFFRHDPALTEIPSGLRPIYPVRIRMRHYGYRSPGQISMRLATRREPMARGEFVHEKRSNWLPGGDAAPGPAVPADLPRSWRERIVPHGECYVDSGVDSLLPPLAWTPPDATPRDRPQHRLEGSLRSVVERLLHLPEPV